MKRELPLQEPAIQATGSENRQPVHTGEQSQLLPG